MPVCVTVSFSYLSLTLVVRGEGFSTGGRKGDDDGHNVLVNYKVVVLKGSQSMKDGSLVRVIVSSLGKQQLLQNLILYQLIQMHSKFVS